MLKAALGIDFGTTNSTVCLYDGTSYHYVDLEDGSQTIPSLLYVDSEFFPTHGEAARSRFLIGNLNRRIKLEKTDLGYIEIALGDGAYEMFDHTGFNPSSTTYDAKVTAFTDQNLPGFLFASTKRLLGQSGIDSIKVFDKRFKLEAVVSSILQNIEGKTLHEHAKLNTPHICVGRPVNYENSHNQERSQANAIALERMDKALEHAGIRDYTFFLEPIAPVLSYLHENQEETEQDLLVLDFGGGTLDFSLLKKEGSRLRVVGNFGRSLGGDIITELLIRDYIFPELGLSPDNLKKLKAKHNYLEEMVPDILNWRTTYVLNQPKYFMRIDGAIRLLPEDAVKLNRIRLLIERNFSYNIFYAAEAAKKRLSDNPETDIDLPSIGIHRHISRENLEDSMRDYLAKVETSIDSFCLENGYDTSRIGRVLLTGGTSLIPCIRRRMEHIFPKKVVSIDPFLSIVKGFALGAWLESQGRVTESGDHIEIDLA